MSKSLLLATPLWIVTLCLFVSPAAAASPVRRPVDWVKLNPAFDGATNVDTAGACSRCHRSAEAAFNHTMHARVEADGSSGVDSCQSCHGPRSNHVKKPTGDLAFAKMNPSQQSAVCLQCHEGGTRFGWKSGAHQASDVSCTSCHDVMHKNTERGLLAKASGPDTCYQCHRDVRGQMLKVSHHPVREGRMDCSGCHNVHGSTPGMLTKNTLNETCNTCHTDKRGPFLWEHAPVRESCANCHEPHGSNHRAMLTRKDSFLCLSCHSYGGHINLPRYNRTSNPYGSGCMNCHITPHGSNHPSGAKQTR